MSELSLLDVWHADTSETQENGDKQGWWQGKTGQGSLGPEEINPRTMSGPLRTAVEAGRGSRIHHSPLRTRGPS